MCNYNAIHKMEPESFGVFMNIIKRFVLRRKNKTG